jgi:hypothetical protein
MAPSTLTIPNHKRRMQMTALRWNRSLRRERMEGDRSWWGIWIWIWMRGRVKGIPGTSIHDVGSENGESSTLGVEVGRRYTLSWSYRLVRLRYLLKGMRSIEIVYLKMYLGMWVWHKVRIRALQEWYLTDGSTPVLHRLSPGSSSSSST